MSSGRDHQWLNKNESTQNKIGTNQSDKPYAWREDAFNNSPAGVISVEGGRVESKLEIGSTWGRRWRREGGGGARETTSQRGFSGCVMRDGASA